MDKEVLVTEESFISSNVPGEVNNRVVRRRVVGGKVILVIDNLRISAYPLLSDHPEFVEGHPMYEVLGYWAARPGEGYTTKNELETLDSIANSDTGIIELRMGTFKVRST